LYGVGTIEEGEPAQVRYVDYDYFGTKGSYIQRLTKKLFGFIGKGNANYRFPDTYAY